MHDSKELLWSDKTHEQDARANGEEGYDDVDENGDRIAYDVLIEVQVTDLDKKTRAEEVTEPNGATLSSEKSDEQGEATVEDAIPTGIIKDENGDYFAWFETKEGLIRKKVTEENVNEPNSTIFVPNKDKINFRIKLDDYLRDERKSTLT